MPTHVPGLCRAALVEIGYELGRIEEFISPEWVEADAHDLIEELREAADDVIHQVCLSEDRAARLSGNMDALETSLEQEAKPIDVYGNWMAVSNAVKSYVVGE